MSFSKKYMEIWHFLQIFWKDGLSDTMAVEYGLSCIIRKDNIYFSQKHDLIIKKENERSSFSKTEKKSRKYDIFCIFGKDGISFSYKYDITLLSKKQTWYSPDRKDDISSINEKDDIHPRKFRIYSDTNIKDDKNVYSVKYP